MQQEQVGQRDKLLLIDHLLIFKVSHMYTLLKAPYLSSLELEQKSQGADKICNFFR